MPELTEEDARRYDRQIRLWGVSAQRRLASSTVLLIHCSPLTVEIAKNLALAGCACIRLLCTSVFTYHDMQSTYCGTDADIGSSFAMVLSRYLSELNPSVKSECFTQEVAKLDDNEFSTILSNVDLVVISEPSAQVLKRVESRVIGKGIPIMACACFGRWAYMAHHLGHEYTYTTYDTLFLNCTYNVVK